LTGFTSDSQAATRSLSAEGGNQTLKKKKNLQLAVREGEGGGERERERRRLNLHNVR